jgi:integrase
MGFGYGSLGGTVSGKLTALAVTRANKRGMYSDGGGLYLQVTHANAKSWVYRYALNGKTKYMGLGSASAITLKRARELVVEPRRLRAEGIDPLDTKRSQRTAAARTVTTFKQCATDYMAAHQHAWRSTRHRDQWYRSLEADAYPVIGPLPVADIDTGMILRILRPIWQSKPQSASRLRGRIESVLDAAKAADLRTGENPARWRGHLENLLAAPPKAVDHYPAMPYADVPAFMAELRTHPSISARALEFTILTTARTGEVIGARWGEIDGDVWTISASRMKAGKAHRVPLAPAATAILNDLRGYADSELVFGLHQSSMSKLLQVLMNRHGITVHGFRSSFRDWAAEHTDFPNEVVEMALAHIVKGAVERAYRRGDLFDKRRKLMLDWARYCSGASTKSVG